MARTFSKAHGLAGLRVGYGIASERIADYAERVRFPVSVNLAAQVAATASMHAREKVAARAEFVVRERDRLQEAFREAEPRIHSLPGQLRDGPVRRGRFRAVRRPGARGRGPGLSGLEPGDGRRLGRERPGHSGTGMSRTLGIVGVGLIGGSVGLAARKSGWYVVGVDSPDVLEEAEHSWCHPPRLDAERGARGRPRGTRRSYLQGHKTLSGTSPRRTPSLPTSPAPRAPS